MGINPANSHYESFTFNGTTASTYGVYVTDVNVFDAPAKEVEYLTIPGRNGAFPLDKGSFENITIKYSCAMEQDTESDFADAISEFRNLLASAEGYCRLEDDMNAGEYRMAVFSSGVEVDTANKKSATFEVEFNCKPQRFLTSGETAVSLTSGDTITNPTLFDASPLLQVWGYGGFTINGEELEIINQTVGDIQVYSGNAGNHTFDTTYANIGDRIFGDSYLLMGAIAIKTTSNVTSASITSAANWNSTAYYLSNGIFAEVKYTGDFSYGTAATDTATFTISATTGGTARTISYTANAIYDGADRIRISTTVGAMPANCTLNIDAVSGNNTWLNSSTSTLGAPLYFDLDIGEAYIINGGSIASVNNAVTIPAELPTLVPGANTITFDNTITQFKIVPRWWKV